MVLYGQHSTCTGSTAQAAVAVSPPCGCEPSEKLSSSCTMLKQACLAIAAVDSLLSRATNELFRISWDAAACLTEMWEKCTFVWYCGGKGGSMQVCLCIPISVLWLAVQCLSYSTHMCVSEQVILRKA